MNLPSPTLWRGTQVYWPDDFAFYPGVVDASRPTPGGLVDPPPVSGLCVPSLRDRGPSRTFIECDEEKGEGQIEVGVGGVGAPRDAAVAQTWNT